MNGSAPTTTAVPLTVWLLHPLRRTRAIPPASIAHAVHGLVIFLAIVGATFVSDYPAATMLLSSAGAVVLFWIAHVYAAILAHGPAEGGSVRAELAAVRREAVSTLPLLEACLAPAIPLVLAMFGLLALPLAYAASLTIGVLALAAVGFVAVHGRGASLRRALVAAAATGGLGAAIIAAETFWH